MNLNSIREKWIALIGEIDLLKTEDIYNLFNPCEDVKKFFELVDRISQNLYTEKEGNKVDTKLIRTFRITAVSYLLECQKEAKEEAGIVPPNTNTLVYPTYPLQIDLNTSTSPRLIQPFYCQTSTVN